MIRFADESMLPELTKIWEAGFGDSEEYIDMFLKDNFYRIKTVVWEETERPVSVAYFLPLTYLNPYTTEKKAYLYLYAAATLPSCRGKGYFGKILTFVKEHFAEPVLLVPGEPSLVGYYQKNGLNVCQNGCQMNYKKEAGAEDTFVQFFMSEISGQAYFQYREKALQQVAHMCWELPFITYICKENRYCGGRQIRLSFEDSDFIAVIRQEASELQILEMLSVGKEKTGMIDVNQKDCFSKAVQILMHQTGCMTAKVCVQPTVMCNDMEPDQKGFYFNLTLG